ncbi:unnamed protein product [Alternaria alternata]
MDAVILVLIDGMSHMVHDELYTNGGGAETAMRLRAVVREKLAAVLPAIARSGRYQIVIKIFAWLKRLSCHVIGGKRPLAVHFAEFTKVSPFFDFVDTGDENQVSIRISVTGLVVDENIRRLGLRTVSFANVFKASQPNPRIINTTTKPTPNKAPAGLITHKLPKK